MSTTEAMGYAITAQDAARFWERVHFEPNTGCWLWEGSSVSRASRIQGAHMWLNKAPVQVHYIAWMLQHGAIPSGMQVQRCPTMGPVCVNPEHLSLLKSRGHTPLQLDERADGRESRSARTALCVSACRDIPTEVLEVLVKADFRLGTLLPGFGKGSRQEQVSAVRWALLTHQKEQQGSQPTSTPQAPEAEGTHGADDVHGQGGAPQRLRRLPLHALAWVG